MDCDFLMSGVRPEQDLQAKAILVVKNWANALKDNSTVHKFVVSPGDFNGLVQALKTPEAGQLSQELFSADGTYLVESVGNNKPQTHSLNYEFHRALNILNGRLALPTDSQKKLAYDWTRYEMDKRDDLNIITTLRRLRALVDVVKGTPFFKQQEATQPRQPSPPAPAAAPTCSNQPRRAQKGAQAGYRSAPVPSNRAATAPAPGITPTSSPPAMALPAGFYPHGLFANGKIPMPGQLLAPLQPAAHRHDAPRPPQAPAAWPRCMPQDRTHRLARSSTQPLPPLVPLGGVKRDHMTMAGGAGIPAFFPILPHIAVQPGHQRHLPQQPSDTKWSTDLASAQQPVKRIRSELGNLPMNTPVAPLPQPPAGMYTALSQDATTRAGDAAVGNGAAPSPHATGARVRSPPTVDLTPFSNGCTQGGLVRSGSPLHSHISSGSSGQTAVLLPCQQGSPRTSTGTSAAAPEGNSLLMAQQPHPPQQVHMSHPQRSLSPEEQNWMDLDFIHQYTTTGGYTPRTLATMPTQPTAPATRTLQDMTQAELNALLTTAEHHNLIAQQMVYEQLVVKRARFEQAQAHVTTAWYGTVIHLL